MFFIIGNPRSGTSLFRLLLTSHRNIHVPPECGFLIWWFEKYRDWHQTDNNHRLAAFVDDLFAALKFEFWDLKKTEVTSAIVEANPGSYSELCCVIYRYHAHKSGKPHGLLGDKNNFHLQHVPDLVGLYPDAKFVHIIRDGRDVATSYISMGQIESQSSYKPNLPSDMREIAEQWRDNINSISRSFAGLPKHQKLEIRYEDLVLNSDETLASVCKFLNQDYDPQMLEFYLANETQKLEPAEFMAWKARTLGKIDASAIGKFRHLPEADILTFETVCGSILSDYNYDLHTPENSPC